jgi:predicted transcriptional regulator
MAELCLVIKKSTNSGGVSLTKINIISEAILSEEKLYKLKAFMKNSQEQYLVKYDPIIVRILQYLIYERLIILQGNQKYRLTEKGKEFVKKIANDETILVHEKKMLDEIGYDLKEEKIDQLQLMWRY